jgi:transposase
VCVSGKTKKTVATFTPDTSNTLFKIAADLINQSSRNIFLTGKAGTGKTTFLKYIRENCPKQMAVVAPTGVAAINAGGVTIHSFLQIPPCLFLPTLQRTGNSTSTSEIHNRHSLVSRLRFNHEKRKVLQQLELLVIDEVSMVRADLLDAIDTILRHVRKRPLERFGGVQVLFIGDMFQLPPVTRESDWKLLAEYYNSPFFFDSMVLKEEVPVYIEFEKIYRQSEADFIQLLNQVRNNELDEEGAAILTSRYQPAFRRTKSDGYIILTTHNEQARNTNAERLQELSGKAYQYDAEIENDFPQNAFPADETLYLKEGAQVMFIKNDTADKGKRFFNGKIGVISGLEEDKVFVRCEDEPEELEVCREKWENIRYTVNKTSQMMDEEVLGSFSQFPLRLAWAITIHKSQGLTFDKAIIDAGEAFAPGQVYVALSRCTSLGGMVLKSKLRNNSFFTDPKIVTFSKNYSSSAGLQQELDAARKEYQEKLLLETFDFRVAVNAIAVVREYLLENESSFNQETLSWTESLSEKINILQDTGVKFHPWIKEQFLLSSEAEQNTVLQERIKNAAVHFSTEIKTINTFLQQSPAITDSRQHAKEYNEGLKEVFTALSAKKHLLQSIDGRFSIDKWHLQKKSFILPGFSVNAYAGASQKGSDNPHPLLHMQLKKLRDNISSRKNLPIYLVAGSATLDEMARYLPQSLNELRKISGFGDTKIEQYGQPFLDIIIEYCQEHQLESLMFEKTPKRERKPKNEKPKKKGDSHAASFMLYNEGKSIAEIAKERSLTISTIEGHLARFVSSGDINIDELVSGEKFLLIEAALKDYDGYSINPVKARLGNDITYGELRMVMAALGIKLKKSEKQLPD